MVPFEAILSSMVLLFAAAAYGDKTVSLDIDNGDLQQYQTVPLMINSNTDIPFTIEVNCNDTVTRSMFYVTEEMYESCTVPMDADNGPRIQCPDSSSNTIVDYVVALRPVAIPGVVFFQKGGTYHFAFYEGEGIGSLSNAPCLAGLKFALHIQDPTTITTPTPTPTSTSVSSTTTSSVSVVTTTVVAMTTTSIPPPNDDRTSTTTSTTMSARSDGKTTIPVAVPTRLTRLPVATEDIDVGRIVSGASPIALSSLLLPLLMAVVAVAMNYIGCNCNVL